MNPEALVRLRDVALSNYDVHNLLVVFDQLTTDRAERLALFDIDPTGRMTDKELADYRRKFRELAELSCDT